MEPRTLCHGGGIVAPSAVLECVADGRRPGGAQRADDLATVLAEAELSGSVQASTAAVLFRAAALHPDGVMRWLYCERSSAEH
jgi:hypothetical protein